MSLYSNWKDISNEDRDQDAYNAFWGAYLPKEQAIYEAILGDTNTIISGKLSALAKKYDMKNETFAGFLDGINSSLKEELNLDSIKKDTVISLEVDLETLYYNMLDAKADWLYNLPLWDDILTTSQRKEIKKEFNATKTVVKAKKIGRNDPCPCGSGRKFKQCCMNK